jgi:hypothetical protein
MSSERNKQHDMFMFKLKIMNAITCLILTLITVTLILLTPASTQCINSDVFIHEAPTFRCINKKCQIYNMTYVSYTTVWDECIETRSKYIESNELNDTLSEIHLTNNTRCYYPIISKCNRATYGDYFQWIMIFGTSIMGLLLLLSCCIFVLICCCAEITTHNKINSTDSFMQ